MVQVERRPLVLVTGASGFVGSALCSELNARGYAVRRALRTGTGGTADDVVVGNIDGDTNWSAAVAGVDAIVHLAARTHVLDDIAADPLREYRRINVEGTRLLAEAAAAAGVPRFVFMSSIKVNGERTHGTAYTEADAPRPEDAYGVTKLEAEEWLREHAARRATALVVLRPPLVYGPGVKGNFLRLMKVVHRGVPLPVKSIRNARSLVYVGNLVDAVLASLRPEASGTYLVSDGIALSTPALVAEIAAALGREPAMLPFPVTLLELAGRLTGRSSAVSRLTGSLEVDAGRLGRELAWRPPYTLAQGLAATAQWYHAQFRASSRTA